MIYLISCIYWFIRKNKFYVHVAYSLYEFDIWTDLELELELRDRKSIRRNLKIFRRGYFEKIISETETLALILIPESPFHNEILQFFSIRNFYNARISLKFLPPKKKILEQIFTLKSLQNSHL